MISIKDQNIPRSDSLVDIISLEMNVLPRRHVPPERDSNIAVNGCSWFATSTQKGPFTPMLVSHSSGTYLISVTYLIFSDIAHSQIDSYLILVHVIA